MSKLPDFWQFFNLTSQPSIPSLYWNAYSYEERIKKICDKIWCILKYLKLIMEHMNESDDRLTVLEELYNSLEIRVTNLELRMDNIEGRVSDVEQNIIDIEENINTIKQEIIDINNIINNIEETISNINNEITLIKGRIDNNETNITEINNTITNITELITGTTTDITDINIKLNELQSQVDNIPIVSPSPLNGYIKIDGVDTLVYLDTGGGSGGGGLFNSNKSLIDYKQFGEDDYGVYKNVFNYVVGDEITKTVDNNVLRYTFKYPCNYGVKDDIAPVVNLQLTIGGTQLNFGALSLSKTAANQNFNLECEIRITKNETDDYDITALIQLFTADPELWVNDTLIKTLHSSETGVVIVPQDSLSFNVMLQNGYLNIGWFQCNPENPTVKSGSWQGVLETDLIGDVSEEPGGGGENTNTVYVTKRNDLTNDDLNKYKTIWTLPCPPSAIGEHSRFEYDACYAMSVTGIDKVDFQCTIMGSEMNLGEIDITSFEENFIFMKINLIGGTRKINDTEYLVSSDIEVVISNSNTPPTTTKTTRVLASLISNRGNNAVIGVDDNIHFNLMFTGNEEEERSSGLARGMLKTFYNINELI